MIIIMSLLITLASSLPVTNDNRIQLERKNMRLAQRKWEQAQFFDGINKCFFFFFGMENAKNNINFNMKKMFTN